MKRIKGIATILMVACMLISCFMFNSTYAFADTTSVAPATPAEKIDAAIWDTAPDENGRYLVYISRDSITDESIENEFNKRNEFDLSDYKDKKTFRWEIGSSIAMNAFEKYGMRETFDIKVGRELFNDELVPIEYEFIEYYNGYLESKRQVISDLYEDYNKSFVENRIIDDDTVLYEGIYTGSYILYATQAEIENFAEDKSVLSITVFENAIVRPATNLVHTQIHTDSSNGTKSTNYNSGSGYKGTGIKIGIVEAGLPNQYGIMQYKGYDPNSPQLSSIHGRNLFYVDQNGAIDQTPPNPGDHATLVASIIVGQSCTYNGHIYEGVVPEAMAYLTSATTGYEFFDLVQMLINDYNVNVINHSASIDMGDGYSVCDFEVDKIVKSTSVSFVNSAANLDEYYNPDNYVCSPGLGYNVITVGNLNTKDSSNVPKTSSTFPVASSSSYKEYDYITNKPDLVAPGTYIACVGSNGVLSAIGTSFSAPLVTAVIAQVFQADETLMDSPTRTKAVLLAGADITKVGTNSNQLAYTGSTLIREKSGVGMLSAVRSVEIAENNRHSNIGLLLDGTGVVGKHNITNVTLNAGQTIRIVLTYDKPNDPDSANDDFIPTTGCAYNAGLELYNGSTLCKSSNFEYSNVEVILYTVPVDGDGVYTIKTFAQRCTKTHDAIPWIISVAWYIS